MVADTAITISGFSGLNLDDPISALDNSELSECINLNVGKGGQLVKRFGYELFSTISNTLRLLGHFRQSTGNRMVVANEAANATVYFMEDGGTLTSTSMVGTADWGLQYADKYYVLGDNGVTEFSSGFSDTAINTSYDPYVGTVHKDRLFLVSSDNTSRLRYSDIADFATYQSDSFIDVSQGDGEDITALIVLDDKLIIFKEQSIWALYVQGDPSGWVLDNLTFELGAVSKYAVLNFEGAVYFIANESVYYTDGVGFQSISIPIEKFFQDRALQRDIDLMIVWDYKLICKCYDGEDYRIFVYNFRSNAWTEWTLAREPTSFFHTDYDVPGQGLYFTDGDDILKFNTSLYTDEDVFFTASFSTKDFDFDDPSVMKRGKWCALDAEGDGITILEHYADNQLLSPPLSCFPVDIRRVSKLRGPGYFRTWRFRITLSHENEFKFYGLTLYVAAKRPVIKSLT